MRLTLNVTVPKGIDWRVVWGETESQATGQDVSELIRMRTERGLDATGRPFAPYSTKKLYVNPRSGIGLALTPKGGRPSRTGNTVVYDGGYAQYKRESKRATRGGPAVYAAGSTAAVDLAASGRMMLAVRPRSFTAASVIVGVGDEVATQAAGVHERRPFIGLSEADLGMLVEVIALRVGERLKTVFGGGS